MRAPSMSGVRNCYQSNRWVVRLFLLLLKYFLVIYRRCYQIVERPPGSLEICQGVIEIVISGSENSTVSTVGVVKDHGETTWAPRDTSRSYLK